MDGFIFLYPMLRFDGGVTLPTRPLPIAEQETQIPDRLPSEFRE